MNLHIFFKEHTVIEEIPQTIHCNIIRFDKESLTGKLRILNNNCENLNSEYPFQIIGNQDKFHLT